VLVACSSPQDGGEREPVDSGREDGGDGDGDASQNDACDPDDCGDDAHCEGTRCVCDDGFSGDGVRCEAVDRCTTSNDCDDNAECVESGGVKSCACNEGFSGDGLSCTQLGCSSLICDPNATCAGEDPQCACGAGFTGDGEACGDVNECQGDDFECASNAECVNTFGGYGCECAGPYAGNGKSSCKPLCEIALDDRDVCAASALCRVDGHEAVCDACEPGFEGTGRACTASSDCGDLCDGAGTDDADNAVCAGGDSCECAPGYEGDPASGCDNIDECEQDDRCGDNASCTDLPGGYFCECADGYAKNDDGECVNVDECEGEASPCHPNATCTDSAGSFSCACKDGYSGDGSSCRDIDECADDDACEGGDCTNTAGSFTCGCGAGMTGEPGNCYCDLSGMWAMRQDVDTCWEHLYIPGAPMEPTQALIAEGETETTTWELHKLVYDGEKIVVEKKGCGADGAPDLTSPYFQETYSSYVPNEVFDELDMARGVDINEPGIVPGRMFTTDDEAAVVGIDLGDDPLNAEWPASYTEIADPGGDVPAWSDTDSDGVPGMTAWPKLPTQIVADGSGRHYSYLPAAIDTSFYVSGRAGCVSLAARTITRLEVDVESCSRMVGEIIDVETKGRVQGCTLIDVPTPGDQDDPEDYDPITCTADDWDEQQACGVDELDKLDADENQAQVSKVQFELIRIGDVDDEVTCADVREQLPAFERNTPTITCRD
jgi:hypothetical protein